MPAKKNEDGVGGAKAMNSWHFRTSSSLTEHKCKVVCLAGARACVHRRTKKDPEVELEKGIYVCCVGVRSGTMRLADCDKELANVD